MTKSLSILFIFIAFQSIAQQKDKVDSSVSKLTLRGIYTKTNLYIQNPLSDVANNIYCTDSIIINGKRYSTYIDGSAYEINLNSFIETPGTEVTIIIYHKKTCKPKLLSTRGFPPPGKYELTFFEIDSTGHVHITTYNESPTGNKLPFHIDQYRGSKWRTVMTIPRKYGSDNIYDTLVKLTAGRNVFQLSKYPYEFSSLSVNVDSEIPETTCSLDTSENCITCSDSVYYRLENRCMEVLSIGYAKNIDVSTHYNESYTMFYDNNLFSFKITKRKKK